MSSTSDSDNIIDPYALLHITKNPDGSFTRLPYPEPCVPPSPQQDSDNPVSVLSKDVFINRETNAWARVYIPCQLLDSVAKLPLIVYIHGGGFVICTVDMLICHKFCNEIAQEVQAVVVSVEYRLAPEHRLPAAYDDCMEALHWIKASGDEWLTKHADISKCFLMGTSAGGNLAYHLGLRAISVVDDLAPLEIQGLILHQPFFGGVERTSSEVRLANGIIITLCMTDVCWELGLPTGSNRDHEYSNPMMVVRLDLLEKIKERGWRVVVIGYYGDLLIDRQVQLVDMLKEKGIDVFGKFDDGGYHGVEFYEESRAKNLYDTIKKFVLVP